MKDYVYAFDDKNIDKMSLLFESRIGDSSGEHEQEYMDTVKLLMSLKRHGSMLDIGAGIGRLIAIAESRIDSIVALEPDRSRWADCHKTYHKEPDCEVLCMTTAEYLREQPERKFDLVVIGMVLQHMSTHACDELLADTATLLKPDGVALIFTTHALEASRGFSFSNEPKNMYLDRETFNDYASAAPSEQTKGLPVRRFSKSELLDAVAAHMEPIHWRQCSYHTPQGQNFYANLLGVSAEELKDAGNSQIVIARKQP